MNDPFGPAHIYWVGQVNDKIITNADGKYYEFESKSLKWNLVSNSDKITQYFGEEAATKKIELISLKKIFEKNRVLDLPYDVNTLHPYNNDSVIVCTQSGLYHLNSATSKLNKINTLGVVASDVYQINKDEELGLISLTQDNCIWSYKNHQWSKLFDYKETMHYYTNFIKKIDLDTAVNNEVKIAKISSFYPKGIFNISQEGKIILTTLNSIFVINPANKQYQIINSPKGYYILEAELISDGKIFAIGDFNYDGKNKFLYKTFLFSKNEWKLESNNSEEKPKFPILSNHYKYNKKEININKMYSNQSFLYPMSNPEIIFRNETILFKFFKKHNYNGYYYLNKINSKIMSGYLDSSFKELYLGTQGSGVILIK
ncbi:MAG: hypothetical protein Q8K64_15660 [Sediminibacterium sp.]|nr:hypothetical protein [Sediminibacterium sp.]